MKLLQALLLGLFLVACATDPIDHLESYTPTLSSAQVAELRKHSVPAGPETAGELRAPETVTLPLVEVRTDQPKQPGGRYRYPIVLGTINGNPDVRLLLDSGSNQNLFGYQLARRLQIPVLDGLG